MSFGAYMSAKQRTATAIQDFERASACLELARMQQRIAELVSQNEPVASTGIDRDKLEALLRYIQHGDKQRLAGELPL